MSLLLNRKISNSCENDCILFPSAFNFFIFQISWKTFPKKKLNTEKVVMNIVISILWGMQTRRSKRTFPCQFRVSLWRTQTFLWLLCSLESFAMNFPILWTSNLLKGIPRSCNYRPSTFRHHKLRFIISIYTITAQISSSFETQDQQLSPDFLENHSSL